MEYFITSNYYYKPKKKKRLKTIKYGVSVEKNGSVQAKSTKASKCNLYNKFKKCL